MTMFSSSDINAFYIDIKEGRIKPDHVIENDFGGVNILQAIIKSDLTVMNKHNTLLRFIKLGCDVDQFVSSSTAISFAAAGSSKTDDYKSLVSMMLTHHEFGHMSDLNIMRSAINSLDADMFYIVLASNMIDVNAMRAKTHILHFISQNDAGYPLRDILEYSPEVLINPINRKGLSPLAVAINSESRKCILRLNNVEESKIIGEITDPELVIDYGLVKRYDGDFWSEFPTMVEYAVKRGKENLLPQEITDVFIF